MNSKSKVVLIFLTLFGIGFASGYLYRGAFPTEIEISDSSPRQQGAPWGAGTQRDSDEGFGRTQSNLSRWMDLDEDQRELFFRSLAGFRSEVREIMMTGREEQQTQIRLEYERFRAEMEELLNERQLSRLDARLHPDSVRTWRDEAQPQRRSRGR